MRTVMIDLEESLSALQRYCHPRVEKHQPRHDVLLELLVKVILTDNSLDCDHRDLFVRMIEENFKTEFLTSDYALRIYDSLVGLFESLLLGPTPCQTQDIRIVKRKCLLLRLNGCSSPSTSRTAS